MRDYLPVTHERPCETCAGAMVRGAYENRQKWEKRRFCSRKCISAWNKGLAWTWRRGENSWNWRGGRSSENAILRSRTDARTWARNVKKRDDFTCQVCGQRGGELEADHIKPWAMFPESRYDLSNGRTLCIPCHRKTDTYAWRTREAMRAA